MFNVPFYLKAIQELIWTSDPEGLTCADYIPHYARFDTFSLIPIELRPGEPVNLQTLVLTSESTSPDAETSTHFVGVRFDWVDRPKGAWVEAFDIRLGGTGPLEPTHPEPLVFHRDEAFDTLRVRPQVIFPNLAYASLCLKGTAEPARVYFCARYVEQARRA